jgi:hypothetical protein
MINTEIKYHSSDIDNNNQLNIVDTSNQILDATPQSQSLALSSTQNINIVVSSTLDKSHEKTNITCPLCDLFELDDHTTAQGLSHSCINY